VDGILTEKNMRLLTSPLYASWAGPGEGRPFAVLAYVGLFHAIKQPPVVPDVMLSLDVDWPDDLSQKVHNSYFVWFIGKFPEVVIEIVSNLEGGEDTTKMQKYERLKILYYVIFDPDNLLGGGVLRAFQFDGRKYRPTSADWLEEVGLGLRLWEGGFEGKHGTWLRWCDRDGQVIPTGEETTEAERQRANEERQRAEQATQRAEQARQEAELLRAKLRELGIEPPV
jgi:Uma2 family endonuclease